MQTHLSSLAGEVIGTLLRPRDTFVKRDIAAVVGGEDGELEAGGVQQVDVELAVSATLRHGNVLADRGDV